MKKALVIQLTRFGDLIQTKRLVLSLQTDHEVHLCVDISLKILAQIIYPNCVVHTVTAHATNFTNANYGQMISHNLKTFDLLKKCNFSEIYNLNFSGLNYSIAKLFDPTKIYGHKIVGKQEYKGEWFEFAFRLAANRKLNINIVDYWALLAPNIVKSSKVNPIPKAKGGGIGVVMAGRESRRSLPVETLTPILLGARSVNKNKKIYLLGTLSENKSANDLITRLPQHIAKDVVNLTGKTDWKMLVDQVAKLDLILSPDTGTLHLAAHLGIPTISFFLSSAWCTETGPYGEGHLIFQSINDCSPCVESTPCPFNIKCLESFDDPKLIKFIINKGKGDLPPYLIAFKSKCDELGTTYFSTNEENNISQKRALLRGFVTNHKNMTKITNCNLTNDFAQFFYKDKDYITSKGYINE